MKKVLLIILVLVIHSGFAFSVKLSPEEYVEQWKDAAIHEMNENQIPASITLAQAILESGSGNSLLAVEANNHFGIKCHKWDGPTFHKDDDEVNECFRKYKHARLSYTDHSEVLKKTRYAKLFTYDLTDYRAWAYGLKEAGYATSTKYPALLIDLIERLNLTQYDRREELIVTKEKSTEKSKAQVETFPMSNQHEVQIHENSKIKYVVTVRGDTYYRISKEFGVALWQLRKYNDFGSKKDYLLPGDLVYLQPKKRNSKVKKSTVLLEDVSLRSLAQLEGVKIQRLMKMNRLDSPDVLLKKGDRVALK